MLTPDYPWCHKDIVLMSFMCKQVQLFQPSLKKLINETNKNVILPIGHGKSIQPKRDPENDLSYLRISTGILQQLVM